MFIAKCKKDLLLLVDTSNSIGKDAFDQVKKSLKKLVMDSRLNVGPDGTEVGLILFSSKDKTEIKLRVGQIEDAQELKKYISNLQWNDVMGRQTRTEMALNLSKEVSLHFRLFTNVWCNRMEWVLRGWCSPWIF